MFVTYHFISIHYNSIKYGQEFLNNLYCKILAFLYQKSYKNKSKFSNMHNVTHCFQTIVSTYIRCTREYLKHIFLINFCHQKHQIFIWIFQTCWTHVDHMCFDPNVKDTYFLVVFMVSYILSHLWWSHKNNTKGRKKKREQKKPL